MTEATGTPEHSRVAVQPSSRRDGLVVAGTYRVLGRLGAGSMGEVFEAEHVRLGSSVAVKFLREGALDDPRAVLRFQSEARAIAGVQSEHVVRVFDCGELPDGVPYLVMERLVGEDLRSLLARTGVLPIHRAVRLVTGACHGLAAVHSARVVHRDLKPANLFVSRRPGNSEICKILDFGVAKTRTSDATQHGHLLGTLRYMAPEQLEDAASATIKTDLYALGAILYECLTGAAAHGGSTFQQTMLSILNDSPKPLSHFRAVPPELEGIVLRALSRNPDERPASARDFALALRPYMASKEGDTANSVSTLVDESIDLGVALPERRSYGRVAFGVFLIPAVFALGVASGYVLLEAAVRAAPTTTTDPPKAPALRAAPTAPPPRASQENAPPPAELPPHHAAASATAPNADRNPSPRPPARRRLHAAERESESSRGFDATNPYAD